MSYSRDFYPANSPQPAFTKESVPPMDSSSAESSPEPLPDKPHPKARGKLTEGPKSLQGVEVSLLSRI